MATDIAFALGALAVLGSRIPEALKVFLAALAIVDDLGALLVTAISYTASIDWRGVALIVALLLALWVANRIGARRGSICLLLGLSLWAAFFMSGLHPTLAGVLTALFVPARVKIVPDALPQVIRHGILPVFELFNAGVAINAAVLSTPPTEVPLGIMVGLVIGKPVGIGLASWLASRPGWANCPKGRLGGTRSAPSSWPASTSPWRSSSTDWRFPPRISSARPNSPS